MIPAAELSDAEIRTRCDAGNFDGALALALELYADELFGFINGLARDRTQAEDAFSAACERMWKGLSKFRWDSTFRVWAYRIARNEFLRVAKGRARKKTVPLSEVPSIQVAVARVRSATPVYERTEVKQKLAELRLQLDPEDHMLLGLRIDRKLAWADIAKVLAQTDAEPTARELAALRKKFERLKARLREVIRS
ncbi:MAG TPA: sigma-70 family RNA polymerase sigma factor [Kofleriaceae bacterium]|nr:sigma-70 family RNA polymerase sigma factor [Kofleriaceae bacterium]